MEKEEKNKAGKSEITEVLTYRDLLKRYEKLRDPKTGDEKKLLVRGLPLVDYKSNNFDILHRICKNLTIDAAYPKSKEFEEFEKKHRDLYVKYSLGEDGKPKMRSVKDQNGQPVSVYDIRGNEEALASEAVKLDEENQELINIRAKQIEDFEKDLDKEYDKPLNFYYVSIGDVNSDIDQESYLAIKWMIKK